MTHDEWLAAAAEEYRRLGDLLDELDEAGWKEPTECAGWAVRDVVAHLVGAACVTTGMREGRRQARLGRKLAAGRTMVDGMNEVQVRERADRTPQQLQAELAEVVPRALRARRRIPALVRAVRVPFGPPLGTAPIGYLTDTIYTRDAWMHRVDITRATGAPLVLTAEHDGRLVADVVADWARRHRAPYRLELTGPAGGSFQRGTDAPLVERDAVEFCRALAGRDAPTVPHLAEIPF